MRVFEYLTDNKSFILKYSHPRILGKRVPVSTNYPYLCPCIMKYYLCILSLLTICFVALPTGAVWACGGAGVGQEQEKVALQANDEHCPAASDDCIDTHPGQDCPPDTDGCGQCHCPGCGATGVTHVGFFKNHFTEAPAPVILYDERAANFCYRAPSSSAHLAALFRPPIFFLV